MNRTTLVNQIKEKKTFLCVGLDPDTGKMPAAAQGDIAAFNRAIIDATAPYCVAYKPNIAFYEPYGAEGLAAFADTVSYLRSNYPNHLVIADAKRGDIGNTAAQYARTFFDHYQVDALTVAPYMGRDSVTPFLREGHWVVLLALTSNPGSLDFQLTTDATGKPLFQRVIEASQQWATPDELMYVAGATRGELLAQVRAAAPRNFLLVPGVGAQGGSLEDVCQHAMIPGDCGLLVNSSRGIIYASHHDDYPQAAAAAAHKLQQQMALLLM